MIAQMFRRRLRGSVVLLSLLCVTMMATPFLLTTQLTRLALGAAFPANGVSLRTATLGLSGRLALRDFVLHDTGERASEPLVGARELDVEFAWTELLSRRLRRVRAAGVTVHARSNGSSLLSLVGSFLAEPMPPERRAPIWIDSLDVDGTARAEPSPADAGLGVTLRMTTSGIHANPARQLEVAVGDVRASGAARDRRFDLRAEVEIAPAPDGTRVLVRRLAASHAVIAVDSATVRRFVSAVPPEIHGAIETGFETLTATGSWMPTGPATVAHLTGGLAFSGLHLRVPGASGSSQLTVDDVSGAASLDTSLPPGPGSTIVVERLALRRAKGSIDAEVLRRYATRLPAEIRGPIDVGLESMDVSGRTDSTARDAPRFAATVRLRDLGVRSSAGEERPLAVDQLTAGATVETRLDRSAPEDLAVRDGTLRSVALRYGENSLSDVDVSWHADGRMLSLDRFAARLFDGRITGSSAWDLAGGVLSRCDARIERLDMHRTLANLSPENLDAEGTASGSLGLAADGDGRTSGHVDLAFDGPGVLKIGEVEELRQMLVGNLGLDLANLAMRDLKHYRFEKGRFHLESSGANSELKIEFARQQKIEAEVTPPHRETIAGKEVLVGGAIVPTIDLTIPITGKSLGEILAMAGGIHPLIENVRSQPGK